MEDKMKPYAHYIVFPAEPKGPQAFARFIQDVEKIIEAAPEGSDLCGRSEAHPPVFNDRMLIIGSKNNSSPFGRLKIAQNQPWPVHRYPLTFVDTKGLPYDTVICAILLAFVHFFPASNLTTDGSKEDWAKARALYTYATERQPPEIEHQNEE